MQRAWAVEDAFGRAAPSLSWSPSPRAVTKSASLPAGTQTTAVNPAGLPSGITPGDQDVWQFRFRAHKDFYP